MPDETQLERKFVGPAGVAKLEKQIFGADWLSYSYCFMVTITFNECDLSVITYDPLEIYTFTDEEEALANEAFLEARRAIKIADKDRLEGWAVFAKMRNTYLKDHEKKS